MNLLVKLRTIPLFFILTLLFASTTCCSENPNAAFSATEPPVYGYEIIAIYPHDPDFFTQGLVFNNGVVYEGTGLYGSSRLLRYTFNDTRFDVGKLPNHLFGEGVTVFGEQVVQLTWKAGIGIVWDKKSFQVKRLFRYPGEGWGITHDGRWLIMSNGTSSLSFIDPITFSFHHHLPVFDNNGPVQQINELEYIKGEIWANIWKDDRIIRIDPVTGRVISLIDLSGLAAVSSPGGEENVLNGIAYDKENDRIFVTGKRWDKIYEIKIVKKSKKPW